MGEAAIHYCVPHCRTVAFVSYAGRRRELTQRPLVDYLILPEGEILRAGLSSDVCPTQPKGIDDVENPG